MVVSLRCKSETDILIVVLNFQHFPNSFFAELCDICKTEFSDILKDMNKMDGLGIAQNVCEVQVHRRMQGSCFIIYKKN